MRIGVNIPNQLYKRLEPLKATVNVSEICREAIELHVRAYEDGLARISAGEVPKVVDELCVQEQELFVDWQEVGLRDAIIWVERARPQDLQYLAHRQDIIRKQGRLYWEVPPPHIAGVEDFRHHYHDYSERFIQYLEAHPHYDIESDSPLDAEREYMIGWLGYLTAVQEKVRQRREALLNDRGSMPTVLPEVEAPEQLV